MFQGVSKAGLTVAEANVLMNMHHNKLGRSGKLARVEDVFLSTWFINLGFFGVQEVELVIVEVDGDQVTVSDMKLEERQKEGLCLLTKHPGSLFRR